MKGKFWIFSVIFLSVVSCGKEMISRFDGFRNPGGFPDPVYKIADNPVTEAGFILGRRLFYEPRLSRNNTISCGSCHIQSSAFTQHGHDVSHGIDDRLGRRNSPPIMNLAWMPSFMWDGGVFDLDLQPVVPITAHEEMDESIGNVLSKLRGTNGYPDQFLAAFGDTAVTNVRMLKALSQFMLMCISDQSRFDSMQRNQARFTEIEQQGYAVFTQKCVSCHKEPFFTDFSFRNNGLQPTPANDQGRYEVTLNEADRYRFKVPSLRNLVQTAPYMHDGRFLTIEAVLDHYQNGVRASPTLDPSLRKPDGSPGISLTATDRAAIAAFLRTLTDRNFLTNPILSEQ